MPVLASGNSTSLTLGTYDSITLQNRAGQSASLTIAGVLVNGAHSGTRTYGPYPAGGAVSLTATAGDVYYETADGRGFTKPVEYTEEGPSLSGDAAGAVQSAVREAGTSDVIVALPAGVSRLADLLPKSATAVAMARGGRHMIVGVLSDSTVVGNLGGTYVNAARSAPYRIIAKALGALGLRVNTCNFFGAGNIASVGAATPTIYDPRITYDGNVTLGAGLSFGYDDFRSTVDGATLSFQCDEPVDTVRVFYRKNGGSFPTPVTVDIGGSVLGTTPSGSVTEGTYSVTVPLGVAGLHKINLKNNGGGAATPIVGMMAYNSANPGVSVVTLGWAGAKIGDLANATTPSKIGASHAALGADLMLVGEQINDWLAPTDLATRNASCAAIITQCKNGGNTDVVWINGPRTRPSLAPEARQQSYFDADIATAAAAGVPLISCRDVLGPNNDSAAQNLIYADNVGHMTALGYGKYGYSIAATLIAALA